MGKHDGDLGCGCCLEPATDETLRIDLCSEATGTFDGSAWYIKRCQIHAAAPDLLAALQRCYAHFDRIRQPDMEPSTMMEQARAAIAKATGAQS